MNNNDRKINAKHIISKYVKSMDISSFITMLMAAGVTATVATKIWNRLSNSGTNVDVLREIPYNAADDVKMLEKCKNLFEKIIRLYGTIIRKMLPMEPESRKIIDKVMLVDEKTLRDMTEECDADEFYTLYIDIVKPIKIVRDSNTKVISDYFSKFSRATFLDNIEDFFERYRDDDNQINRIIYSYYGKYIGEYIKRLKNNMYRSLVYLYVSYDRITLFLINLFGLDNTNFPTITIPDKYDDAIKWQCPILYGALSLLTRFTYSIDIGSMTRDSNNKYLDNLENMLTNCTKIAYYNLPYNVTKPYRPEVEPLWIQKTNFLKIAIYRSRDSLNNVALSQQATNK